MLVCLFASQLKTKISIKPEHQHCVVTSLIVLTTVTHSDGKFSPKHKLKKEKLNSGRDSFASRKEAAFCNKYRLSSGLIIDFETLKLKTEKS